MATSTAQRQKRENGPVDNIAGDEVPPGAMGEPLGSINRPVSLNETSADVIDSRNGVPARTDRSFTTTFAIAAVVLLLAFLVALYLGSRGVDTTTSTGTEAPISETAPAVPGSTTGSTDTTGGTAAPGAAGTTGTGTTGTSGATAP